jgi:hypothetical protein
MPDDEAATGHPALVQHELADLAVHLDDRLARDLRVVGALQIPPRRRVRAQFEIGHVDVDDAVHQAEAVERVVGARVVDDRKLEAPGVCERQRFEDLRDDMLRRDPVDVVAADRLEVDHDLGQPLGRDQLASHLPRDVVVLAEDAAEVAPREEDRPRPALATEAVLLAEVREIGGNGGLASDRAETCDVGSAVDLAAARTDEAALAEQLVRLARPGLELGRRQRHGQHVRCSTAAVFCGSSCA